MSDAALACRNDEPRAWEWREHHLLILPGITWEEWTSLWETVDRTNRSAQFFVGDALLAGQREFGEQFAQVVDGKYLEQQRGAMWVCSRIPPAERRPSLSYSAHKAVASLDSEERLFLLKEAEENDWGAREIAEAVRKRKHNGHAPEAQKLLPPPAAPVTEAEAEPEDEDGPQVVIWDNLPIGATVNLGGIVGHVSAVPTSDRAEEIRGVISLLRKFATERRAADAASEINHTIARVFGLPRFALSWVENTDAALTLIPDPWLIGMQCQGGEFQFGGRKWSIELSKGEQRAYGEGPILSCAIIEAALSAVLSDMGQG